MTESNLQALSLGEELQDTNDLPAGLTGPSDEQLKQMKAFAVNYRQKNPHASERQVRRSIMKKFPLKIIK